MDKRYYWLKLKEDFFNSKQIKKLRRMAGGDTYTIIYLKMQLKSLKSDGVIQYTGLESEFADELALDIDENVDDVRMTLAFLQSCNLIETSDYINYFLPETVANTGSECDSAKRVREHRERQLALLGNADVTTSNADVTKCNTEKEKEKREEKKQRREEKRQQAFAEFWKAYPKKKAKQDAIKAFDKLKEEDYPLLIPAIEWQKQTSDWKKEDGKYIPHPATWLNGRRWEDERDSATASDVDTKPLQSADDFRKVGRSY